MRGLLVPPLDLAATPLIDIPAATACRTGLPVSIYLINTDAWLRDGKRTRLYWMLLPQFVVLDAGGWFLLDWLTGDTFGWLPAAHLPAHIAALQSRLGSDGGHHRDTWITDAAYAVTRNCLYRAGGPFLPPAAAT